MPVDSLLDIVTRACVKISKRIKDVGEIPYDLIRPVLLKIESPEQLHQLEEQSPQLIGHDEEIWLSLIKRDIPNWESKPHQPKDPKNWWKVYRKLKQESESDMSQGEDKLKAALNSIQSNREQNLAQIVTRKELPRSGPGMRARVNYTYTSGIAGSKGASKHGLMEKIKKEARDAKEARLAASRHQLHGKISTQISYAPLQFVEDVKKAEVEKPRGFPRARASPERAIRAPRKASIHTSEPTRPEDLFYQQMRDREARLRALTSGKPPPTPEPKPSLDAIPVGSSRSPTKTRTDGPCGASAIVAPSEALERGPSPHKHDSGLVLDSSIPRNARHAFDDSLNRSRTASPGRVASPVPGKLKRKEPPSLFMATPPRKVIKRPGPGVS